jgi:hypothetical protein
MTGTTANDTTNFRLVVSGRFDLTEPSLSFGESQGLHVRWIQFGVPGIYLEGFALNVHWEHYVLDAASSSRYDESQWICYQG